MHFFYDCCTVVQRNFKSIAIETDKCRDVWYSFPSVKKRMVPKSTQREKYMVVIRIFLNVKFFTSKYKKSLSDEVLI